MPSPSSRCRQYRRSAAVELLSTAADRSLPRRLRHMEPYQRPRNRRLATPLYDARFEHDACGVGFVADAGGHSRDRVLPLALAGLGALGHRGAFGADGESSDGAGVALPLDRSVLALLTDDRAAADRRPAVVVLFLPRGVTAERAARVVAEAA